MINKFYRNLKAWLPVPLLLQTMPLQAQPLYHPISDTSDFHTIELGAAVMLSFVLFLGKAWKARKHEPILKTMPYDAAWFDSAGRCLDISQERATYLKKGKYLHETLPEESARPILDALRDAFETGKPVDFEFSLPSPEACYEGNVLLHGKRALCLCRNITPRKKEEIRLLSESARWQSILMSIGSGVITTDTDGKITYLNPEAEKLTGWKKENAEGLPLSSVFRIFTEASRESTENPALIAMNGIARNGNRNNFLLVHKDGEEFAIDESAAPISNGNGEIIGAVIAFHDISSSKHLIWQAGHDALTGLHNRVLLHDRLMHAMASVKRQNKLLAVLFIDLDGFKAVNDNLGHAIGDMLLKEVGNRLKKAIRAEDTAARIGGDEFVILQEAADKREVKSSLERIMNIMRAPFAIEGIPVNVTLSMGIAFYPENDVEPETILRQADMAMYHAKQSGRNQYHFFDARMDRIARENHERQLKIESALKNGELCLYYQPKINLKSGRIVGFEALIRWHDPNFASPVLPADFLPTIQDTPLIVEIGNWVIGNVLEQMRNWQDLGLPVDVSINIASRQLHNPDFLDIIRTAFETYPDVEPSRLELEILETTAIADFQFIHQVLSACHEIGLKLSLDDFGTGYASLSYLKNLPVDKLKIDRSFVSGMPDSQDNLAIIRSIVSMSRIFNREVIAEGLESASQGKALIRLGCKLAQGFAIAKPMPSEAVPEWMAGWTQNPDWISHVH